MACCLKSGWHVRIGRLQFYDMQNIIVKAKVDNFYYDE